MKTQMRQELLESFAKISVMSDTFAYPEKYVKMSESEYVDHVNKEAKRQLQDGKKN